MRKVIIGVIMLCILHIPAETQNPFSTESVFGDPQKFIKPVPLTSVREADMVWSMRVWRVINFKEKRNLPFYYPIEAVDGRWSFMQMILKGMEYNLITPYQDEEFLKPIDFKELMASLEVTDTFEVIDLDTGLPVQKAITKKLNPEDIYQIRIKEDWYIDKQKSCLEVRILGICPVLLVKDDNDNVKGNLPMFWINFKQARLLFANVKTFNPYNDATKLSYDDIFMKRYFSSYIIKKSNVYNRYISEYKTGMDAMLESEQIKDEIFNTELDLWEN